MKYYLLSAEALPTTFMERVENEGYKPVKFELEYYVFFGLIRRIKTFTKMMPWDWNVSRLKKGQQITGVKS